VDDNIVELVKVLTPTIASLLALVQSVINRREVACQGRQLSDQIQQVAAQVQVIPAPQAAPPGEGEGQTPLESRGTL